MATITVSSNPSTTGDTLTVNFTTDATNISDILLSKDGGSTYISATSFTSSQAVFNVSSWDNGTYNNCKLKCVYTESGGGTTDTYYAIKYSLKNANSSNSITSIKKGASYSTTISPEAGYTVTEIYCVMNGINVTDSVVSGNNINISNVTGEIVISVFTKAIGGGEITPETLTISNIANITQTEKTEFYIEYSTNIAVAKHEVSWDGGSTFYDKTSEVIANGTSYKFKHDNNGNAGTYQMAIRVTTAKGTTKTSNIFTVTLQSKPTPKPEIPSTNYTVTYNLNDSTSSNNVTSVEKWSKYSTDITANNNYTIKSINVVMNGDDYSSKYVTNNKIDIPLVTGDIYITIVTETSAETQVSEVFDRYGIMDKNFYITYTTNKPVKEHFIQWGNSGFHDVTKTVKSFGNKHILLCDNVADKTWEAKVYDMEVICKDEADTYAHSAKFNLTVLTDTSETFTITNNLSNAINGNDFSTVPKNSTYSTLIIPDTNYSINNITVTMGGVDISSSCVNNENINISQVTGDINITVSTSKIDPTIYTNPSFSVKDFKIVLSENGHTESFTASDGINKLKYSNKKEVVADMSYYIPLVPIDTGSKFRINGLYPYNGGYMEDKTKNGDEYIDYILLTEYNIPIWTYTNWNFSYGIKNAGIEDELLNKSIYNFNTGLPAFNVYVDNTSTNTIIKGSYSDSWFGQTTFMSDHFETTINNDTCHTDYGGSYGDSTVISNKWISTVTHEIGHSVGFMDNPDHNPTLYSYNRSKDICTYLQAPDIYTLKYLYIKTYGIDISKSQEEITAQATKLGLTNKTNDMPMMTYSSRSSCQICFDYNYYDKNELEDKSDVVVEGQLNFKEVRNINIGKDLTLEYNVYTISTNNIIKGALTNMELKIHVSEQLDIDNTNNYRLYLKQYDNVPCSLINPNQGIEKI